MTSQRLLLLTLGATLDPNASAYVSAVASADGQSLESGIITAINNWYVGVKADGYFSRLKQVGLHIGPRTIAGAMQPLAGVVSTTNALAGDYNRKTGFASRAGWYVDPKRLGSDDPQNSHHMVYYTTGTGIISTLDSTTGEFNEIREFSANQYATASRQSAISAPSIGTRTVGFTGLSRTSSANYILRNNDSEVTVTATSTAPRAKPYLVWNRPTLLLSAGPGMFYSIGEGLTSAELLAYKNRSITLINAIQAVLP
jgi:hypothetical protein